MLIIRGYLGSTSTRCRNVHCIQCESMCVCSYIMFVYSCGRYIFAKDDDADVHIVGVGVLEKFYDHISCEIPRNKSKQKQS